MSDATVPSEVTDESAALGPRALRTREAIIDAARGLFLDRGYSGVRISNITNVCGISRAGFYTYFRDKDEIFQLLGEATYRDILDVIGRWDSMPDAVAASDVEAWVRSYFDFMDVHGAFIFSSNQSPPPDEEFRDSSRRVQMRVAWLLGTSLRTRQRIPTDAPEALGLLVNGLLDQAWYRTRFHQLPVAEGDMVRAVSAMIIRTLSCDEPTTTP